MTRDEINQWKEHGERLHAMAVDDGDTWDLSENDQAACNAGGDAIMALLAKAEHDKQCESEMTSHGYMPCRCSERSAALRSSPAPPAPVDEMQRRWSRCAERSDRQQAALEAWNDYMGEQYSEGPESSALHPRAAAIWRQAREALASVAAPAPETPARTSEVAPGLHVAHSSGSVFAAPETPAPGYWLCAIGAGNCRHPQCRRKPAETPATDLVNNGSTTHDGLTVTHAPAPDAMPAPNWIECPNCGGMGTTFHDILVGGTEHDTEERCCEVCKGTGKRRQEAQP